MAITDYFKIQFKKPNLSSTETDFESLKKDLNQAMESAYSRMESLEILSSNGKTEDFGILSSHILLDLVNIVQKIQGLPQISSLKDAKPTIDAWTDSVYRDLFQKHAKFVGIDTIEKITEEDVEVLESSSNDILTQLDKKLKHFQKSQLKTSLDDYKKRLRVQVATVVGILVLAFGSFAYNKIQYPRLKPGFVQIYTQDSVAPVIDDANSTRLPLQLNHNWQVYSFDFPETREFDMLRIDPIDQNKMKVQVKSFQVFDAKGKELKNFSFQLDANGIPVNYKDIIHIGGLKTGKSVPGGYSEIISLSSDPFFTVKTGKLSGVAKITVEIRVIEAFKKFQD